MCLLLPAPSPPHIVGPRVHTVPAAGGAAVLVSHDRERIEKLAGRTVELPRGRLA